MLAHYDFVNPDIMSYFSRRLTRRRATPICARLRQEACQNAGGARGGLQRADFQDQCAMGSARRAVSCLCRRPYAAGRVLPKNERERIEASDGTSRNISVSEASRPVLPRHAKLKFDETRQRSVILAPGRVLAPQIKLQLKSCSSATARAASPKSSTSSPPNMLPARAIGGRRHRYAAGPRRQGIFDRGAGEDVMSPTLTDAEPAAHDPSDGLAVLESARLDARRRSAFRSRCSPS